MKLKNKHKGQILRVKTGYNPNSSSVGSQIPAFLAFAASSGTFTIIALHTLNAIGRYIRKRKSSLNSQKTKK